MRFKKATPGEGAERRAEQFSYTRTEPGFKNVWYAWCAHEPYWCKAHEHTDKQPGTKVCVAWFTDGALSCPRCRPGVLPSTIGYVPVWREDDLAPCMVIVHEQAADKLEGVEFGTYVKVFSVKRTGGVVVSRAHEQKRWRSDLPYRQGPCDIAVSLLTMWNYPALTAWVNQPKAREVRSTTTPSQVSRLRLSVPPPQSDVEALAIDAEKKDTSGWDALVTNALDRAKKRQQGAEKNGKPHAEGERPAEQ